METGPEDPWVPLTEPGTPRGSACWEVETRDHTLAAQPTDKLRLNWFQHVKRSELWFKREKQIWQLQVGIPAWG